MLSKQLCQQAASIALALTLSAPQIGFAATAEGPETKLIFPGQVLPKELGFAPLKVGSQSDAEVQITARDWFLLKDSGVALANPVPGKFIDYVGPVLEANNAQMYFRLVSGMILKESMVQMGMNAAQARRLVEKAGADFDKASLAQLGDLPKGLDYLAENWDRTNVRMAILPNLLLPLAVAHDQSQFQHFAKAQVDDQEAQKTCAAINTAAPIGPIEAKIVEKQKQLETINTDLKNAQARKVTSEAEQVRLKGIIDDLTATISTHRLCFSAVEDRVSRGAAVPDAACLSLAASKMTGEDLPAKWRKFTDVNMKNDRGDVVVRKELENKFAALKADVDAEKNEVSKRESEQDTLTKEQAAATEQLNKLNALIAPEKAKDAEVETERQSLKTELLALQTAAFKLKTGALKSEVSEEEYQKAVAASDGNEKRMTWIDQRIKQIVTEQPKRQNYQASLLAQIQGVNSAMDVRKARLESLDRELNEKDNGRRARLARLNAELAKLDPQVTKAVDEATFSEWIVSILKARVTTLDGDRTAKIKALDEEVKRGEKYAQEIVAAQKTKDDREEGVQSEINGLQSLIASYRDIAQMGWFLETDCLARAQVSGQKPGVYLSRAKIQESAAAAKTLPTAPVDGGRWGLFNLDYAHFSAPIQAGVLLNVPAYVQMAVQQILSNYDFAMTQTLDPAVPKCADIEAARGSSASVLGMMRLASAIWTDGSDQDARAKASQCRTSSAAVASVPLAQTHVRRGGKGTRGRTAPVAPVVHSVRTVNTSTFPSTLTKLMAFDGTVLDAALPQTGQAHPKDLIERQAITLLGRELSLLAGTSRASGDVKDSSARRDELIKALIRVLATDYEGEVRKQAAQSSAQNQYRYVFATAAPGRSVEDGGLNAGETYSVKTLGAVKLYTEPVAKSNYESAITLSLNDAVKILPIDQAPGAVRAGWVKVQSGRYLGWLPAWSVTGSTLLDESGAPVQGYSNLQNCQHPRVVTMLTNFRDGRTVVPRFAANLKTRPMWKKSGIYQIDDGATETVEPASTNKTYIACESFAVQGQPAMKNADEYQNVNGVDFTQVMGIRIVEARLLRAANGQTLYIPQETQGGFVQTWAAKGKGLAPRIALGAELDPSTWSVRQ